jgi:hypothetical protein
VRSEGLVCTLCCPTGGVVYAVVKCVCMLLPPPTHHALPLSYWGLALGLQVVAGREYKGSGFLASPNAIIFKDFEVGKPMKIRFLFTNVSLSFNSFKGADWP